MTLLAANVMHFARLLRRAGLPVGPSEARSALRALALIDIGSRAQVRTALRAAMTRRHEHQKVLDAAFDLFWRDPAGAQHAAASDWMRPSLPPRGSILLPIHGIDRRTLGKGLILVLVCS